MGTRPIAGCELCRKVRPLCDSHLVPAAALALLRSPGWKNPNPIRVSDVRHYTTSKPLKGYVLCGECEERFSALGEHWVLDGCHRGENQFKIRDALLLAKPVETLPDGLAVYEGASISSIDMDQIIYFALSFFWRAAVREWRLGPRTIRIDLGPYLEPLRVFLLERGPFPKFFALGVRVSSLTKWIPCINEPESKNCSGYGLHAFSLLGLGFFL